MDRNTITKPVTLKLVGFLIWALAISLSRTSFAQETSIFFGTSPPVSGSTATLTLNDDPKNKMTFQWDSSDFILGDINTGEVTATVWNFFPGSDIRPARLVFVGGGDGAQFRGNVLFEGYNRAVVDVVKGNKRVRYLLTDVRVEVFRDAACSLVLDDWPQSGALPRSPKYIFGKQAPICIKVMHRSPDDEITVHVHSEVDPNGINIPLKKVGTDLYQSRAQDASLLFLADSTGTAANGRLIHVRDEEIINVALQRCANVAHCGVKVMVDRGECAAATPKDEAGSHPNAMEDGFVNAANAFMDTGCLKFDAFTTNWWNAGKKFRADSTNPMTEFIRNAGSNDSKHKEADFLFASGHSNPSGKLSGGEKPNNFIGHFAPAKTDFFRKTDQKTNPFTNPDNYFFSTNETLPTFTSNRTDWNEDIDWAMLYSCNSLNDQEFDIGTSVGGVFNKTGSTAAWKRWISAFNGKPRGLHGILGYKGTGSGSNKIVSVINNWVNLVKQSKSIPKSWLRATRENGDAGAVVFIPLNYVDTIDSMQRDPSQGESPMYVSTGTTDRTKKKILKNGKFKAGGKLPQGFELNTVYDYLLVEPKASFLGGQCDRMIDFPTTSGSFPKLLLRRDEVLLADSIFTQDADGVFRVDLDLDTTFVPNMITKTDAELIFRDLLATNFTSVPPSLESFGVFPGVVATLDSSFESGFEIFLEQRVRGLTVFNSEAFGSITPDGIIELAEVVFYDVTETGMDEPLISPSQAADIAASDLLLSFPETPCNLTDMLAYYTNAMPTGGLDEWEVRPIWAVEFHLGEVVYIVDGVTGDILERDEGL